MYQEFRRVTNCSQPHSTVACTQPVHSNHNIVSQEKERKETSNCCAQYFSFEKKRGGGGGGKQKHIVPMLVYMKGMYSCSFLLFLLFSNKNGYFLSVIPFCPE